MSKICYIFLLFCGTAQAGLISEVTCTLQEEPDGPVMQVSDSSSCQLGFMDPSVFVNGLGHVEENPGSLAFIETETANLPGGGFSVVVESWAGARPLFLIHEGELTYLEASATTNLLWTLWLHTTGPPRPGTLRLAGTYFNLAIYDAYSINKYTINETSWSFVGVQHEFGAVGPGTFEEPIDVLLGGRPFPITIEISADYESGGSTGNVPGQIDIDLEIYAFELDGTPVALTETPEPASLGLMLSGLALVLWRKRRG